MICRKISNFYFSNCLFCVLLFTGTMNKCKHSITRDTEQQYKNKLCLFFPETHLVVAILYNQQRLIFGDNILKKFILKFNNIPQRTNYHRNSLDVISKDASNGMLLLYHCPKVSCFPVQSTSAKFSLRFSLHFTTMFYRCKGFHKIQEMLNASGKSSLC